MNEKLQQAIVAARNGQSKEAQLLLTQSLKENPEETQAWFLLSTLVESKKKKIVYLNKVLALDPQHTKAKQMLARVYGDEKKEEVETVDAPALEENQPPQPPVSVDSTDYLAQEKGDTVPDWLANEEGLQWEEMTAVQDPLDIEESLDTEEVPDWLQEEVSDTWTVETSHPEAETVNSSSEEEKQIDTVPLLENNQKDNKQQKQEVFLTWILIALTTVAIIISGTLIYLIWNML